MFPEYGKDQYGCSWELTKHWPGGQVKKASDLLEPYFVPVNIFEFADAGGDKVATMAWEQSMPEGVMLSIYEGPPILGGKYRTGNRFWAIVGDVTMVDNEVGYISPRVYQYVCPCEGIIGAPSPAIGLLPILGIGLLGLGAVWVISKATKKRK